MIRHASAGTRILTIGVQVTPFEWHLALSWFRRPCYKVAIGIGPICVAFYFAPKAKFSADYLSEN